MAKIKKNDTVMVLTGKDKGKTGKVLSFGAGQSRVIVEGVNFVKKHVKKTKEDQQGGILEKEAPIQISNLAVFCKKCSSGTKVGYSILKDGSKSRFCKKCNEVF
jgi:large subunit ribosomal protein L24